MPFQRKTTIFPLLAFVFLFYFQVAAALGAELRYTVAMPAPHTHYFEVEMELSGARKNYIDYKMPVWAPGSYLIREFAKNVEAFSATGKAGKALRSEKINKNTWRVYSNRSETVKVQYKVYAYELSVRTSYLDAAHGYINGTSVFMYPAGFEKQSGTLEVKPYPGWARISTGLRNTGGFTYQFPDYDVLADSPLEIGNHEVLHFTAAGVPHEVAMFGPGNFEPERLLADMKKVVEQAVSLFGELPLDRYVFIVHNLQRGGGGLEHLNSTTLQTTYNSYNTERGYAGFMGLVAHEYFHLWNVKRLRPFPLGPFNYDAENYTTLLWMSEGFTSYYDDLLTLRAGIISPQRYAEIVAGSIHAVENTPGNKVQTVSEASFDAWIKYYRPNENSKNSEVSYYTKGSILAQLLNMDILRSTRGEKSLDDVMRYMYERYYKKLDRGFTEKELKEALELVAGKKLDDFFRDFVHGTKTPDYNNYFEAAGLYLTDLNQNSLNIDWGATMAMADGKMIVRSINRGSSAWEGGLNVNDEVIAIDGMRITTEIGNHLAGRALGEKVPVLVSREGTLQTLEIPILQDRSLRYRLERVPNPTPQQQKIYKAWLQGGSQ